MSRARVCVWYGDVWPQVVARRCAALGCVLSVGRKAGELLAASHGEVQTAAAAQTLTNARKNHVC